jgi:hypothetical protein
MVNVPSPWSEEEASISIKALHRTLLIVAPVSFDVIALGKARRII